MIQAADTMLVQKVTQVQNLVQQNQHQPTSADICVMKTQHHFDGTNPRLAGNHWATSEIYLAFQTRQDTINTFDGFQNISAKL